MASRVVGQKIVKADVKERPPFDFYETPYDEVVKMLRQVQFHNVPYNAKVLDPCAGNGVFARAIAEVKPEWTVHNYDIVVRDYPVTQADFLNDNVFEADYNLVMMNPPYSDALEFVQHALKHAPLVVAFLKLDFLAGKKRQVLYKNGHLYAVYVNPGRVTCLYNGDKSLTQSGTTDTGWFLFQRGQMTKDPVIRWMR